MNCAPLQVFSQLASAVAVPAYVALGWHTAATLIVAGSGVFNPEAMLTEAVRAVSGCITSPPPPHRFPDMGASDPKPFSISAVLR